MVEKRCFDTVKLSEKQVKLSISARVCTETPQLLLSTIYIEYKEVILKKLRTEP